MNCVDARAAAQFCAWIGARLPSARELAWASTSGWARAFPWGHTLPSCELAVLDQASDPYRAEGGSDAGCRRGGPWPVCSKPAGHSIEGLCDVLGNVAEWTTDVLGAGRRVLGGDYQTRARALTDRDRVVPADTRQPRIGFRCALGPATAP